MNRLEAHGLTKHYDDTTALDAVDVGADGGSVLCVIGPSGSGKSTLVRHLNLLEAPERGEVRIDGAPAPHRGKPWLSTIRRFGLVQQRPGLLRLPAWRNVAYPQLARGVGREEAKAEARKWLDRLGLSKKGDAWPDALSGGEAQRVALARALVTRPDFLLVDEGTNQLDPHAVRLVESVVREEAARGCAVVLVTHNVPQTLRMADGFVFLREGRVAEQGPRTALDRPATEELRLFLETGF